LSERESEPWVDKTYPRVQRELRAEQRLAELSRAYMCFWIGVGVNCYG